MSEILGCGLRTPASLRPGGQPHVSPPVGATIVTKRLKSIERNPEHRPCGSYRTPDLDGSTTLDPQPISQNVLAIVGYQFAETPFSSFSPLQDLNCSSVSFDSTIVLDLIT